MSGAAEGEGEMSASGWLAIELVEGNAAQEAQRRSQEDFPKWGAVAQRTQLQLD